MSKDRDCGGNTPYPIYPMYGVQGGMPGPLPISGVNMPVPLPMPLPTTTGTTSYNSSELMNLKNQVNSLEQRVSNLESTLNKTYSNSYNTTNYQIM